MATCAHLDLIRVDPIVSSLEPGEDWSWCYVDEVASVIKNGA